jgi:hypothetical protein
LEQSIEGAWQTLGPLEPTGVLVRANLTNLDPALRPSITVSPSAQWQLSRLKFAVPENLKNLSFFMQLEAGLSLEIRNLSVKSLITPLQPQQGLFMNRISLWFEQANFLGHSLAMVALAVLSTGTSLFVSLSIESLALLGIYLTGSRAAWFTTIIVGSLFIVSNATTKRLRFILLAGLLMIAAFLFTQDLGRVQVLEDQNSVTRQEIWQFAWDKMLEHPLRGLSETFAMAWQQDRQTALQDSPFHAHNLWLEFGSSYGLPGFIAAVLLSLSLSYFSWKWARWKGLLLVVSVFALNTLDYTLFYTGVLLPFIVGLNILRKQRELNQQYLKGFKNKLMMDSGE